MMTSTNNDCTNDSVLNIVISRLRHPHSSAAFTFTSLSSVLSHLSRASSAGISLAYVLLNLMQATEHFALGFYLFIEHEYDSGDFAPLALVCVYFLGLFIACIVLPPHGRRFDVMTAVSAYVGWVLIAFLPIWDYMSSPPPYRRSFFAISSILHGILIPLGTIFGIASLFPQARLLRSRTDPGAVSVLALVFQTAIFALNAGYWPLRVTFNWQGWSHRYHGLHLVLLWYIITGWVTFDTGVFAIVQGSLLAIVKWQASGATSAETEPLLVR
ncbi:hypothetical protein QBC33DRAFT_584304 [Phialemonium atrogriseum]|uniref:Uncharacterized protein n=1 Tax=Phialemonium atrogriseum TaxID=1093897 RepID=A0AAJ0FM46_9PEZI|nr:uncharacterized protein QBC33DRAFT_584304 [Phialemonium atrogriseum]KAK1772872.1 hypothetical protein QBC33DRAFT_584304 [Phialemonium atrogriseum]